MQLKLEATFSTQHYQHKQPLKNRNKMLESIFFCYKPGFLFPDSFFHFFHAFGAQKSN